MTSPTPIRFAHNTFALTANNILSASLAFLLSILIARGLGDAAFGRYAAVMAWILPLSMVVEGGVGTWLTRAAAQNPAAATYYLRATYRLRFLAGGIVIVLLQIGAPFLTRDAQIATGLRIAVFLTLIDALFASYTAIFRARQITLPILMLNIVYLSLQIAGVLLVITTKGTILDVLVLIVIADGCQLGLTWVYRQVLSHRQKETPLVNFPPLYPKEIFQRALPFMIAGILAALQMRLTILLLENTAGVAPAGQYAVAVRLSDAARLIPNALFAVLLPNLASLVNYPEILRRSFWKSGRLILPYSIGVATLCLIASESLVRLTFGGGFNAAASALPILAWALVPGLLRALLTLYHYAYHREWLVNGFFFAGLFLQGGLGIVLIERDGIKGAAWAVFFSEIFLVIGLSVAALWKTRLSRQPLSSPPLT